MRFLSNWSENIKVVKEEIIANKNIVPYIGHAYKTYESDFGVIVDISIDHMFTYFIKLIVNEMDLRHWNLSSVCE